MYTDLIKPGNHIHFIGIGGVSMSGLAKILNAKGITVTGSDINHSVYTDSLERAGIKVDYPHTAKLMRGADLVVYTAAVKADNPEMIYADRSRRQCNLEGVFFPCRCFSFFAADTVRMFHIVVVLRIFGIQCFCINKFRTLFEFQLDFL